MGLGNWIARIESSGTGPVIKPARFHRICSWGQLQDQSGYIFDASGDFLPTPSQLRNF